MTQTSPAPDADAAATPRPALAATAAQCAIPSQVCDTLEAIIEQVRQQARPGAQVVIMSNGGFGGLHGKLAAALAE